MKRVLSRVFFYLIASSAVARLRWLVVSSHGSLSFFLPFFSASSLFLQERKRFWHFSLFPSSTRPDTLQTDLHFSLVWSSSVSLVFSTCTKDPRVSQLRVDRRKNAGIYTRERGRNSSRSTAHTFTAALYCINKENPRWTRSWRRRRIKEMKRTAAKEGDLLLLLETVPLHCLNLINSWASDDDDLIYPGPTYRRNERDGGK